jgi:hypothetical protein
MYHHFMAMRCRGKSAGGFLELRVVGPTVHIIHEIPFIQCKSHDDTDLYKLYLHCCVCIEYH